MGTITDRIGHLAALAPEYRSPVPPVPKSVKIELSGRCDFQCFFCASHTRPRERSDMPWELYTRRARELRELGVEQLGMFYLGESFLCDWLSDAIRYAKRECGFPYVFLTTNGRLATAARLRECISERGGSRPARG
jgi:MoaA/NifB/PqqE/SkfB family radical SAM enzyme